MIVLRTKPYWHRIAVPVVLLVAITDDYVRRQAGCEKGFLL
jgi:hypothetical protein